MSGRLRKDEEMIATQFKRLVEDEIYKMNIKADVLSETCISYKEPLLWAVVVRISEDAAAIALDARHFQDEPSIRVEINRQLRASDLF